MRVRDATEADKPALVALQLASWRDAYRGVLPDAYLDGSLAADLRDRWAARDLGQTVTLIAGEADGFVCCLLDRTPPYVDNLHAHPARRGAGTGGALMAALFARLRDMGHEAVALTVLEGNAGARRFYARLGGTEGATRPTELMGHPVREVPVTFRLDRPGG